MKFSVMEYVPQRPTFEDRAEQYRAAGVEGVGISLFKPPRARTASLADVRAALRAAELPVTYVWPAVPSILPIPGFAGPRDWRDRVAALKEQIRQAAVLEPEGIGCVTGPIGDADPAEARKCVAEGLRAVAEVAADHGMKVALEPIHPQESGDFSFVSTVAGTADLIAEIGRPGVGMIADVWHLDADPRRDADLARHLDLVFQAHLCDRRAPTRSNHDRVLPGDGVSDAASFLGVLDRGGFPGWYELEVISDDGTFGHDFPDSLWKTDPFALARTGRQKLQACLAQARRQRVMPDEDGARPDHAAGRDGHRELP